MAFYFLWMPKLLIARTKILERSLLSTFVAITSYIKKYIKRTVFYIPSVLRTPKKSLKTSILWPYFLESVLLPAALLSELASASLSAAEGLPSLSMAAITSSWHVSQNPLTVSSSSTRPMQGWLFLTLTQVSFHTSLWRQEKVLKTVQHMIEGFAGVLVESCGILYVLG